MELQRVKMLDDHIVVLQNLMGMISQELSEAMEEKQQLLELLGMSEDRVPNAQYIPTSKMSKGEIRDEMAGMYQERASSPTSPLNLHLESMETSDGISPKEDVMHNDVDHALHFSEDLPTPRGVSCLETHADPDMNNALLDDEEAPEAALDQRPEATCSRVVGKIYRPRSSLNNVDSDSDLEEDEEDVSKPQSWISNTVYTSVVLQMIGDSTDACASLNDLDGLQHIQFGKAAETTVGWRSCEALLVEKASAAAQLTSDVKHLKVELLEREAHIEFLQERLYRCKDALKKETQRRERETRELKTQVNQSSSGKFIVFCKLQAAEARVAELEEIVKSCQASRDAASNEAELLEEGVVDMDVNAQRVARSRAQQTIDYTHRNPEPIGHHPLQEELATAYRKLLEAEKRGDGLQLRVQKLEKDLRLTNKKPKSPTTTTTCRSATTTKKAVRPGAKEVKKV